MPEIGALHLTLLLGCPRSGGTCRCHGRGSRRRAALSAWSWSAQQPPLPCSALLAALGRREGYPDPRAPDNATETEPYVDLAGTVWHVMNATTANNLETNQTLKSSHKFVAGLLDRCSGVAAEEGAPAAVALHLTYSSWHPVCLETWQTVTHSDE